MGSSELGIGVLRHRGRDGASKMWTSCLIVVCLILLVRLPLVLLAPTVTPDGETYQTVADNIRENGCVSVSVPMNGECAPHWGGNQSPFYPAFIAFVNKFVGPSVPAALVLQTIAYALAAAYLMMVVWRGPAGPAGAIATGLVLAFSPVLIGWPRFLLTESFALAGTLWVFAECLRSLNEGKLRSVSLGLALILAVLARYDSILLAIPIAAVGFITERPLSALAKGLVIALMVSTPIVAWTARNLSHGLSPVPNTFMKSGEPTPWGLLLWADTWVTNLYGAQFSYGISNRDYKRARDLMDVSVFETQAERERVRELFDEMTGRQGEAFPVHVDEGFRELATWRRETYPFTTWALVPLRRAAFLWGNPIHSFAWPVELDKVLSESDRELWAAGLKGKLQVMSRYPFTTFVKGGVAAYRYLLSAIAIALLVVAVTRWNRAYLPLVVGFGYAASRTLIIAFQSSLDSRYAIEGYALLEVGVVIALVHLWGSLRGESQSDD